MCNDPRDIEIDYEDDSDEMIELEARGRGELSEIVLMQALQQTADLMNGSLAHLFSTEGQPIDTILIPDDFFYVTPSLKIVGKRMLSFHPHGSSYYTTGQIKFFKKVDEMWRLIFQYSNLIDEVIIGTGDSFTIKAGEIYFT